MIQHRHDTFLPRLGAAVVDGLVLVPLDLANAWLRTDSTLVAASWFAFYSFAYFAYSVLLHGFFGRTIGKWLAGVMVIDVSERKRLSISQALLRDSVGIVLTVVLVGPALARAIAESDHLVDLDAIAPSWLDYVVVGWLLAEIVTMLFNEKRRALHDFIGGSVVVRHHGSANSAVMDQCHAGAAD